MDDKIISAEMFKSETQTFVIKSEAFVTHDILDKDGNHVAKYDAIRADVKDCPITLPASGAPYTVKFTKNDVPDSQADISHVPSDAVVL